MDLLEILKLRSEKALRKDRVDQAALRKVAAYASRETGDARRAVELLAKAVKVAEEGSGYLTEKEVDVAEERLEVDKSAELINALATQQRIALQACYSLLRKGTVKVSTGQAYGMYKSICAIKRYRRWHNGVSAILLVFWTFTALSMHELFQWAAMVRPGR